MLPLGCFPLWGREGVILQAAAENKRIERKEDFNRADIFKKTTGCQEFFMISVYLKIDLYNTGYQRTGRAGFFPFGKQHTKESE
jgi:hypothetical protein